MTSPFQESRAKGESPYWLRDFDAENLREHWRLLLWMEARTHPPTSPNPADQASAGNPDTPTPTG